MGQFQVVGRCRGQLRGMRGWGQGHRGAMGASSDPSPAQSLRVCLAASLESLCLAHEGGWVREHSAATVPLLTCHKFKQLSGACWHCLGFQRLLPCKVNLPASCFFLHRPFLGCITAVCCPWGRGAGTAMLWGFQGRKGFAASLGKAEQDQEPDCASHRLPQGDKKH